MARVIIALGSNLDDPATQLREAARFLETLSKTAIRRSAIYRSEPVGPSEQDFLNAAVVIESELKPEELLETLKTQEARQGRPTRYPKWTARTLDMDIIAYDDLVLQTDTLIIPHENYSDRLFVLLPLQDVDPQWIDPATKTTIRTLTEQAPPMRITQTDLDW